MILKCVILVFMAGILTSACSHYRSSRKDLLTVSPWRYEKAGFDNDDGTFDALDPRIAGNEKDNTVIFCKDGTGYSELSRKTRTANPDSLPFIWAFQSGDSTIYFQDQYYKIKVLTAQRLEIYADQRLGGMNTRYTIVLTR